MLLFQMTSDELLRSYLPLNKICNNKIPLTQHFSSERRPAKQLKLQDTHMFGLALVFHPKVREVNYNYNHYNLPFSYITIIVIISDEDMLEKQVK